MEYKGCGPYTVSVIGRIWWPTNATCAMAYKERDDQDDWDDWISSHTGDFSTVIDFEVRGRDKTVRPWQSEESELIFVDCTYPSED